MFGHLYKYRLKSLLRTKEDIFWCMFFPIILCTCFFVAFSGINEKTNVFHTIPVAVVYQQDNEIFRTVMDTLSQSDSQGEAFMDVTETDAGNALLLLHEGKADAVITVDSSVSMTVAEEGINQTAVKNFLEQYLQKSAVIEDAVKNNPERLTGLMQNLFSGQDYITEASLTDSSMDEMSSYYFSLIAMAALFGGFLGNTIARQMNANITNEGMRKTVAPARRHTIIVAEFLAAYTIQLISMALLMFYILCVLQIDMGNQAGYIALTCVTGSLAGVAGGMFTGSLPVRENLQIAIYLVYSLVSSFLAGLMVHPIKIWIEKKVPVINRINPATLIQDALYSLVIYDTRERFFANIITLAVYAAALCTLSCLMTRRKSYASI